MEQKYTYYGWFHRDNYSEEKVLNNLRQFSAASFHACILDIFAFIKHGYKVENFVLIKFLSTYSLPNKSGYVSITNKNDIEFIYLTEEKFNQYLMLL